MVGDRLPTDLPEAEVNKSAVSDAPAEAPQQKPPVSTAPRSP
jgi:hypothetical protein